MWPFLQEMINEFKTGKVYVRANIEEAFRQCLQKIRDKFRYVVAVFIFLLHLVSLNGRYGDRVVNTVEENFSIFSLTRMHWLPSARA